jgi:hypothetical protein
MLMVVMPMPREKWTDERLDDLNKKVDKGFEETKEVIADTKAEMRAGFARLDADIRDLNRNLIAVAVAIIAAILGSNVALIVAL